MDDYIYRAVKKSITLERQKASPVICSAAKTRNSEGFGSVELTVDNRVVLRLDTETYGSLYTEAAKRLATLLNEIADAPCELPE
jgi:hypothetical protein